MREICSLLFPLKSSICKKWVTLKDPFEEEFLLLCECYNHLATVNLLLSFSWVKKTLEILFWHWNITYAEGEWPPCWFGSSNSLWLRRLYRFVFLQHEKVVVSHQECPQIPKPWASHWQNGANIYEILLATFRRQLLSVHICGV